ncbi:MAG: hypothetical protein V4507_01775 [Verrucomicrobiota bacterium]
MERRWLSGMGEGRAFLSFLPRPSNPPLIHAAEPAALHFLFTILVTCFTDNIGS